MQYRLNEIMGETTYDADTTVVINIDQSDPISELDIVLATRGTANGSMTLHPTACLTKIELMDGSTPLVSLTGLQAEAIDWYTHKAFRTSGWNMAITDNYMLRHIGINFGRYLWDERFAFDPKKYSNPQLKLSLDIDRGGLMVDSNKLQVLAASFDKKQISPVGFLSCIDVADKPLAASSHIYYDLPTDFTLRRLFYRLQRAGVEPCQLWANFKLGENGYKVNPFNLTNEEIAGLIMAEYPEVKEEYLYTIGTANRYLMVAPSARVMAFAAPWAQSAVANTISLYDGDGGRLKTISSSDVNANVAVKGVYPHCMLAIPFGDLKNPDDWYEMAGITKLQLDVTTASGAAATDTGELIVEQAHMY